MVSVDGARIVRLAALLLVGVVALVATRMAMLPGLGFWDTGELQTVAPILGTAHPTGFPTYVISGWIANLLLTPVGEPAFRMNLYAGLCVAVTAMVTADLVRVLTRSVPLGVAAGIGFALTGLSWSIGRQAEAHALHIALVAILIRLLVEWEETGRDRLLVAASVVFGLAMGNHSLTLLLAPPIGLYVLAVDRGVLRRPRLVLGCVAALVITVVLVFLQLPLRAGPFPAPLVYGRPDTWDGFWYIVLAQQFQGSLGAPLDDLGGKLVELAARTVREFGPLAIFVPAGLVATALVRPRYALLTGSAAVITVLFALSYTNADIGRYYLGPLLFAWTWLAILASAIIDALTPADEGIDPDGTTTVTARPTTLTRVATAVLVIVLVAPGIIAAPARLESIDRSGDVDARLWVDHALEVMEEDALIVSWWSYSTPLWYAQHVEGRRPDIAIIDDRTRLDQDLGDITDVIDANLPIRPVYVIRSDPREQALLEERYVLEVIDGPGVGDLSRVVAARQDPA